jgi:lysozyme
MNYSEAGLALTKSFEQLRLTAYPDSKGVPTIGWGHTRGVRLGDVCTPEQADQWLAEDVAGAVADVNRIIKVPLTQNQFDALVDLQFNAGALTKRRCTLRDKLRAGDYEGAAAEFPKWNKVRIGGVLTPEAGLTRRRIAEQAMFEGRDWR